MFTITMKRDKETKGTYVFKEVPTSDPYTDKIGQLYIKKGAIASTVTEIKVTVSNG